MVQQHQRRRKSRRERQASTRALCLAFAMTLLLGSVAALRFAHTQRGRIRANAMLLTPARYQARTTQPKDQPTASDVVPAVSILVDMREAPADLPSLADALREAALSPDILSAVSRPSDTASNPRPNWFDWAHLDAKPAHIQVNAAATIDSKSLGAYATRGDWGTSLCLVNKTSARLLTTAQLRLPQGVYTIERLTLGAEEKKRRKEEEEKGIEEGIREEAQSEIGNRKSEILQSSTHLVHLEGCDFGSARMVRKVFCLEPGQVCIYRCVDSARAARAAWYDLFAQLRVMGTRQSGPARRLSTMLREANGYVAGVRGGGGKSGRDSRLECVHHLLLITAQAHSLHHNYQMRHTVDEQSGNQVMAALDRLTTSLSETSAALLGLVPQVSVASNPVSSVQARATGVSWELTENFAANKKENTPNALNMQMRPERAVTVSLENTGGRSVSNVKLGLNMAGMSGGLTCAPADPAYFDVLRPGQSVRAVFHVRNASGADLPDTLFTGDVSYFAGTAPAHLRPRAW